MQQHSPDGDLMRIWRAASRSMGLDDIQKQNLIALRSTYLSKQKRLCDERLLAIAAMHKSIPSPASAHDIALQFLRVSNLRHGNGNFGAYRIGLRSPSLLMAIRTERADAVARQCKLTCSSTVRKILLCQQQLFAPGSQVMFGNCLPNQTTLSPRATFLGKH